MKELLFHRDGKQIYGRLYLPEGSGLFPAVIIGHGFGGNLTGPEHYAIDFAENGIAAYVFDFVGGGTLSRSDGDMTESSVLTQAADMEVVLDGIAALDEIDEERIFLMGLSQGGFVASYVAAKRPDDVAGLIAFYPAYVLQDDAWERTPDPDHIPDTIDIMGNTVGRIYNKDAMSFDIYDMLPKYPHDVLLMHGTADRIVPISYSERAAHTFPSAKLIRVKGAGHGFRMEDACFAAKQAMKFMDQLQ